MAKLTSTVNCSLLEVCQKLGQQYPIQVLLVLNPRYIPTKEFDLRTLDNLKPDPQFARDQKKRDDVNGKPFFIRPIARFLMERRMKLEKQVAGDVIDTLKDAGKIDKSFDPRPAPTAEQQQEISAKKGWINPDVVNRLNTTSQTQAVETPAPPPTVTETPASQQPPIDILPFDEQAELPPTPPIRNSEPLPIPLNADTRQDLSPNKEKKAQPEDKQKAIRKKIEKSRADRTALRQAEQTSRESDAELIALIQTLPTTEQVNALNNLTSEERMFYYDSLNNSVGNSYDGQNIDTEITDRLNEVGVYSLSEPNKNFIKDNLQKFKSKDIVQHAFILTLLISEALTRELATAQK